MNYSRQREIILTILRSTKSHPTTEWIYSEAKAMMPNISLGTVYRNLSALVESGEIIKVPNTFEKDRYDGNSVRHTHLVCKNCGCVVDVDIRPELDMSIMRMVAKNNADDFSLMLYGYCQNCLKIKNENIN